MIRPNLKVIFYPYPNQKKEKALEFFAQVAWIDKTEAPIRNYVKMLQLLLNRNSMLNRLKMPNFLDELILLSYQSFRANFPQSVITILLIPAHLLNKSNRWWLITRKQP